jgi:hypothetical protein
MSVMQNEQVDALGRKPLLQQLHVQQSTLFKTVSEATIEKMTQRNNQDMQIIKVHMSEANLPRQMDEHTREEFERQLTEWRETGVMTGILGEERIKDFEEQLKTVLLNAQKDDTNSSVHLRQ